MVAAHHGTSIVTIGMQDESKFLSDASAAAASPAAASSYESEEPSLDEGAPTVWGVDLGASLEHSRA